MEEIYSLACFSKNNFSMDNHLERFLLGAFQMVSEPNTAGNV